MAKFEVKRGGALIGLLDEEGLMEIHQVDPFELAWAIEEHGKYTNDNIEVTPAES